MSQLEKVQLLLAFLELQAVYSNPNFEFPTRGSAVMSAVFEALRRLTVGSGDIGLRYAFLSLNYL